MSISSSVSKSKDIEVLRRSGNSLITACRKGDMETVENILEDGGDINYQDTNGKTPLHYACSYGHKEIVYYLLYKRASFKSTNTGLTPLHAATLRDRNKIVHILLQHIDGYDKDYIDFINTKTSDGLTALHIAAENGYLEIVKTLLMHEAIYNIQDATGKTPKDVTRNKKIVKIFRLVEECFKDVQNGDAAVINKLKEFAQDKFYAIANARNSEGETFEIYALYENRGLFYDLENLIKAFKIKMVQLEYLKEVSDHIRMSVFELKRGGPSSDSLYFNSESYSEGVVEYLQSVYILVSQYKSWVPGKINNIQIASLNKLLKDLGYDPRHITEDNAESFVSQRQDVEYYNKYYREHMRGWRQILESVNQNVEVFGGYLKTELRALYFDNLVQFCKSGDSVGVELLMTRIRCGSSIRRNEKPPLPSLLNGLEPFTVMALKTSDGLTPLHIAAVNGHLEVIKTLLRHGSMYNSGHYEGKSPKSLSKHQDVIDFLTLVDCIFIDVKKGDINVISKLAALEKYDLFAVTSARHCLGSSLLEVAVNDYHYDLVRELETLMEPFEKNYDDDDN